MRCLAGACHHPGKDGPREIGEWDYDGTETLEGLDEEEAAQAANRRGIEKNKG